MDDLVAGDPSHIGPFRLLGRLGAGGTGRVYLARSAGGRAVAVKLVREVHAQRAAFRSRFAQEVAAARQVNGAWTAHVLDADATAEIPWVATAYVAGPSLRDVVDRDFGPLPEPSLLVLADRLALALTDIHSAGLVHRDLKPSHVLLAMDGPRVIDFGIAGAVAALSESDMAGTGVIVGSPGFMSPEQIQGKPVTPAGDVFCLGAVLAYAATGRMAFGLPDSGLGMMLFRVVHEEPDLVGVPASLLPVVRACLHKDPERRPTPEQLAGHLATNGGPGHSWLPPEVLAQVAGHAAELRESGIPRGHRRQYPLPVPEDGYRPDPPPPPPAAASEARMRRSPARKAAGFPRGQQRRSLSGALIVALILLALVAWFVAWFFARSLT
ncbi:MULTISPECIES: serine/threonine-protein kinase [unclassified Streptomyces]|uniref:Serine/threonine protein kinase n=1 Tax=Streptomyces sp. NBC_00060 TaxID=2975636 RepID=A0AAU2H2B7_9ACTN